MTLLTIHDNGSKMDVDAVHALLKQTFWAANRTRDTVRQSLENSLCFAAYLEGRQIGFARVVTDKCTFAYLCDVVIDESHRGNGYSRRLMEHIMKHRDLRRLRRFLLATKNAHGLYAKFGFVPADEKKMMEIVTEGV